MHNPNALVALTLVLTTAAIPAVCHAVDTEVMQASPLSAELDGAETAIGRALAAMDFSTLRRLWTPPMLDAVTGHELVARTFDEDKR